MASNEPLTQHTTPQMSLKQSSTSIGSQSPFSSGLPFFAEELLVAYQNACLQGDGLPAFSLRPSASASTSLDSTRSKIPSFSSEDAPVFSLTEELARSSVSSPLSMPNGLRASTSVLEANRAFIHRRTRSHFYALGEAPIFSAGNELQDDDESSEEEETLLPQQNDYNHRSSSFQHEVSSVKLNGQAVPRRVVEPKSVDATAELPESPPSRSAFGAPLTTSASAGSTSHSCGDIDLSQIASDGQEEACAPVATTSPEARFPLEAIFTSPFRRHSQDSSETIRLREWKVRYDVIQAHGSQIHKLAFLKFCVLVEEEHTKRPFFLRKSFFLCPNLPSLSRPSGLLSSFLTLILLHSGPRAISKTPFRRRFLRRPLLCCLVQRQPWQESISPSTRSYVSPPSLKSPWHFVHVFSSLHYNFPTAACPVC